MLWLALHLPALSLEALVSRPDAPSTPTAVVHRERIVIGNAVASAGGITPGLSITTAYARLPKLNILQRQERNEMAALHRLACWAGQFTPEISLQPPQTLLLEISGSLRLFGGIESISASIVTGCIEQGFQPKAALAPTPLAAEWLALGGADRNCSGLSELHPQLASLPLKVLALSNTNSTRLSAFGARTLGDLLHLPRAGLTRRLGSDFTASLGKALGEIPDPRPRFVFPEHFLETIELPAPVEHAPALLFVARRLVAALCGWLSARQSGIADCQLELMHERRHPATRLELGFASPTRDPERIVRVITERLLVLRLPAAITSIALRAESPAAFPGHNGELFGNGMGAENNIMALVERLQARLGEHAVHQLAITGEHRPELASCSASPFGGKVHVPDRTSPPPPRPLWLLPQPQALCERNGRPQYSGPLQLLAGPERIESGWWDSGEPDALGDLRRDYFIALSPRAEWLWIFRNPEGWFLHGRFA